MQINVSTDRHIEGGERLKERVRETIGREVERFAQRITRIEVHLADVNGGARTGPDEIRCTLEARLAGWRPLSAEHHAGTVDQAVAGAAARLTTVVGRRVERQQKAKGRTPMGGESPV